MHGHCVQVKYENNDKHVSTYLPCGSHCSALLAGRKCFILAALFILNGHNYSYFVELLIPRSQPL